MSQEKLKKLVNQVPGSAPQVKILLVDDDSNDLRHYCTILHEHGYLVWPVASHEEGAACVKKLDANLVIVSQGSPAFEGRCVVESAIARDRHLRVVVLARCIDIGCYLEAMQLGAVDYLEKPQDPAEILELVRRHLWSPAAAGRVANQERQRIERSEVIQWG